MDRRFRRRIANFGASSTSSSLECEATARHSPTPSIRRDRGARTEISFASLTEGR